MRAAARLELSVSISPGPDVVPLLGFRLGVAARVKYVTLVKVFIAVLALSVPGTLGLLAFGLKWRDLLSMCVLRGGAHDVTLPSADPHFNVH